MMIYEFCIDYTDGEGDPDFIIVKVQAQDSIQAWDKIMSFTKGFSEISTVRKIEVLSINTSDI